MNIGFVVCRDQEEFCPEKCEKCTVCKFVSSTYSELVKNYFFQTHNKPTLWRVVTRDLDKKIINSIQISVTKQ